MPVIAGFGYGSGGTGKLVATGGSATQQTINGVVYNFLQFTSTSTLTVTKPGPATVILVGGGGGGNDGAGGPGGGFIEATYIFPIAGSYTITVGAGGAANGGAGGTTSITYSRGTLATVPGGSGYSRFNNTAGPTGASGFGAQGPLPGDAGWVGRPGGDGSGTPIFDSVGNFYAGGGSGGGYNQPGSSYASRGGGGPVGSSGASGLGGGGGGNNQAAGGQSGGSGRVIIKFEA